MSRTTLSAAVALVLGALACEPAEEAGGAGAAPDAARTGDEPVTLASVNRSGVTGRARLEREGDEVEVRVDLEGLDAGSPYAVHVLEGRCAEEGEIKVVVGDAVGSQGGIGRVGKEFPAEQLPEGRSYFVQVHDREGNALACGDLDGRTAAEAGEGAAAMDSLADRPGAGTVRPPLEIERR